MKVYYHGTSPKHTLHVQPAIDNPHASADWSEIDGRPKLMQVVFVNGVAEVPDNLGRYLIDKQLASKTKLILPKEVA